MNLHSYSLTRPHPTGGQRALSIIGRLLLWLGGVQFILALINLHAREGWLEFYLFIVPIALGAALYIHSTYGGTTPGIKNNGLAQLSLTSRGIKGILLALMIIGFYISLYFEPKYLKGAVALVDPLSRLIRGEEADHWFLYGFLYTAAVAIMGIRIFYRYRDNRYQLMRNSSVILVQLVLAFLIPGFLKALSQPEFYFSYFWPLKPDYSYPGYVQYLLKHPEGAGSFFVLWATAIAFVGVPILTYFFGKRWYCSWVCGCGGLAETLGDPFRHLSNKSRRAWKFEQWSVHSVLGLITLGTVLLWVNFLTDGGIFGGASGNFQRWYGIIVGSILAGVVGTGFYAVMGSRVWCRFFCPQAAILGILQRTFSRFRITTNGAQCMSCGNCSTYCEMGINVRAYAQQGENIVRASCVGCGICSAVCPRGVLKLENGTSHKKRF